MCSKAKKIILSAIILSALQLLIFSGTSFSTIVGSKHDLSIAGGGGTFKADLFSSNPEDEVCVFCHTPHGGIVADAATPPNRLPLWNRSIAGIDAATFTLYSSSTFNAGELETNAERQPTGMSLLCLSCHDGVSSINVLINYNSGTNQPIDMEGGFVRIEQAVGFPGLNIGESANRDLSNDHPVSFTYNPALVTADNGGLNPPGSISPLRLFNNRLECATCHNPHEQGCVLYQAGVCDSPSGTAPFLRMTNLNSDMCVKCHNK